MSPKLNLHVPPPAFCAMSYPSTQSEPGPMASSNTPSYCRLSLRPATAFGPASWQAFLSLRINVSEAFPLPAWELGLTPSQKTLLDNQMVQHRPAFLSWGLSKGFCNYRWMLPTSLNLQAVGHGLARPRASQYS